MLILIAGVTGGLGQRLATVALSRGLSVRGLGRSPENLKPELASQLESFVTSTSYYDIPALEQAVKGVDAIINAYAPNPILDLDAHLLLLRAAERADVKIFIASSWSRDWTNIRFGDFEHYNNHIAFEHQVANTSAIHPVYIMSGLFADLIYTVYGPGGFDTSGERPSMRYWGNEDTNSKWPWITQGDCAEYTIDVLLHGEGVQAGKGGIFKFRSGVATIAEFAEAYETVHGVKVDLVRKGDVADLEKELAAMRKAGGRTPGAFYGWMGEAAALLASKGLWENTDVTLLKEFRKPTSLVEHFAAEKKLAA